MLSLACEYRVMVNAFTIGFNETQLGIIAPSWCQASMRNALSNRDTELALTNGKMFTTDEALKVRYDHILMIFLVFKIHEFECKHYLITGRISR